MSEFGWGKKKEIWQYWTSALGGTESSSLSGTEREQGVSRAELSHRAGILDWSVVVWERKSKTGRVHERKADLSRGHGGG